MIFEVDRQDSRTTRVVDAGSTTLAPGQVRMSIERFAFTSNNISYAAAGDMLDYRGFFPATSPWGRIPAIGLGSVVDAPIDLAYRSLVDHSAGWLRIEHRQGPTDIEATYGELLNGSADPAAGFICIPNPKETTP